MAVINGKTCYISTISRKNRGLWTVYTVGWVRMTLQSNEYLRRLTTSIIWCKETPSVTVTLSLWFITGLNSGSYPEPNSFFRSLASMPSDWVISDVLFSETNTVAWLYWFAFSSCLTCEGNDELYLAYYFSQNKIKLFYSDLSAFSPDLRFSSLQYI